MAYDKKELEAQSVKVIKKNKIMFIEHLIAYLPCGKTTFYELKLNESDTIKKGIEKNRINRKVTFLNNWSDDEAAPALQIAAMKMICTPDEAHRLNGSKQEIKHNVDTQSKLIEWKPATEKE